ncbi:putative 4-aminobutyrate aminotransferase [Desulforapulum autotrophicum HRM2]|uniref:4-aminobutyrate aminotransferase n=1 Tax=Desulforapulum autotrophicum (strain ATCC 43914 / DSM 3382 / VKM B-1955 / HRM2) TaxID=177437 RepID=C0QGS1_DESAH|nr:putative 4-aminobutyrate aminotransferase [Desulforapulum autotrophicum HRM2]
MCESYIKLAQKLCKLEPGSFEKRAMFANSGAEAVENAIKIARHFIRKCSLKLSTAEPLAGDGTGPLGPKGDEPFCPAGR